MGMAAETVAIFVTVGVVVVVVAAIRHFLLLHHGVIPVPSNESIFKRRPRKRRARVKRTGFEDQQNLLQEYDEVQFDEKVLDSFEMVIDDEELEELDKIVASHTRGGEEGQGTLRGLGVVVPRPRAKDGTKYHPARVHVQAGEGGEEDEDDDDDDLEKALTAPDKPVQSAGDEDVLASEKS